MPYITFTEHPNVPGRQYRDVCTDPATGVIVCEVDEVLDDETEVSEVTHAMTKTAAEAWYEANPPVVEAVPDAPASPTIDDILAVLPADTKAALDVRLRNKSANG